ncbi:MAG TPA: oligopeptide/dipeptide ABC transporter ATP-binding protein, partial [Virgibacillus sp.]|nr:oligopeptide/dipeptide ABC transporter ATP-binding protein [Virgibacillus sp.]
TPPDLFSPPEGCPFTARCSFAMEVCDKVYPLHAELTDTHQVDCWLQDQRAKQLLASIKA